MKNNKNIDFNTDHLLQYLEGRLPDDKVHALESALETSEALRKRLSQVRATQTLLQQTASSPEDDILSPFFTDRLMKQLTPEHLQSHRKHSLEDELALLLGKLFRPVAIAGFFLALCLAVYNINLSNGYSIETSATESILAIPPVTPSAVYDLDFYVAENELLP